MGLQWLTTLGLAFYTFSGNRQRATTKSIDDLNKKIEEKCQRIARLEGEQKGLPTRDELTRIHERIDEIMETSRQNNLLLGELLGQTKELSRSRWRNWFFG
ncbi:hypothetical protein CEK71_13535 [Methylovulum psychrotolerans]|uniref:Uncharacterized protein n=2 Tax=Methylovulum psychrotolerans TaxID=1704499 RepID=A0A1Z4C0I1_9GAMM|nr:hypothetical protein CEK71_13535 [Methylovulum psychrotolerans]